MNNIFKNIKLNKLFFEDNDSVYVDGVVTKRINTSDIKIKKNTHILLKIRKKSIIDIEKSITEEYQKYTLISPTDDNEFFFSKCFGIINLNLKKSNKAILTQLSNQINIDNFIDKNKLCTILQSPDIPLSTHLEGIDKSTQGDFYVFMILLGIINFVEFCNRNNIVLTNLEINDFGILKDKIVCMNIDKIISANNSVKCTLSKYEPLFIKPYCTTNTILWHDKIQFKNTRKTYTLFQLYNEQICALLLLTMLCKYFMNKQFELNNIQLVNDNTNKYQLSVLDTLSINERQNKLIYNALNSIIIQLKKEIDLCDTDECKQDKIYKSIIPKDLDLFKIHKNPFNYFLNKIRNTLLDL